MLTTLRAYLELLRPASLVGVTADLLAGFAAALAFAGLYVLPELPWLLIATCGLYGGGVALNDALDAARDRLEHPERPIARGAVSRRGATLFGSALLATGSAAAYLSSQVSGSLALAIATLALLHNLGLKHHPVAGPLSLGLCRGLTLLLGMSALPGLLGNWWSIALVPLAAVAAVSLAGRGQGLAGRRAAITLALLLTLVAALLPLAAALSGPLQPWALPFLAGVLLLSGPPLLRALAEPTARHARLAVQAGVLSLILLDAALAAGFAGAWMGLSVLVLLPVAQVVGRGVPLG